MRVCVRVRVWVLAGVWIHDRRLRGGTLNTSTPSPGAFW